MGKKNFLNKHLWLKQLLWMIVVSIGIVVAVFIVIKVYARQGQEYELPEVEGIALAQLQDDNPLELNYVVLDSVYHPGEEGGIVIMQTPKAGTMIKKGRKVYITLTAGSTDNVPVPGLEDITLRQAVNLLEHADLAVGDITYVESPFNTVLSVTYKGRRLTKGDEIPMGASVDLSVGMGEGGGMAVIPFVVGKTADKARNALLAASMNTGHEHYDGVKDRATAVVVRQQPDYTGVSQYPFGTTVELWYKDVADVDVNQLVKDFKVDSSNIITMEPIEETNNLPSELEW